MNKPRLYFVDGTAVAKEGEHLFKSAICGFGSDVSSLKDIADVIELLPDNDGLYYLHDEGCVSDSGESYLIASGGIVASGCKGQEGSIGAILSPIRSYNEYVENIQAIKDLLELRLDARLYRDLLRLLFIGVCGEMEGYLSSTIISLIQGVREVFISLRNSDRLPPQGDVEYKWREAIVDRINESFQFQHIRSRGSKERKIYERLIGKELNITQELFDCIEWRNKLAHRVTFFNKPAYPTKNDVLMFIDQSNTLVDYVDNSITQYKRCWLQEF